MQVPLEAHIKGHILATWADDRPLEEGAADIKPVEAIGTFEAIKMARSTSEANLSRTGVVFMVILKPLHTHFSLVV